MRTLHLIVGDSCTHTIHVGDRKGSRSKYRDAVSRLKTEAHGLPAVIVVCDENNKPISFLDIAGDGETLFLTNKPIEWLFLFSAAVLVLLLAGGVL